MCYYEDEPLVDWKLLAIVSILLLLLLVFIWRR